MKHHTFVEQLDGDVTPSTVGFLFFSTFILSPAAVWCTPSYSERAIFEAYAFSPATTCGGALWPAVAFM